MHDTDRLALEALSHFKERMQGIEDQMRSIDRELARRNILSLAHRTREVVELTRDLLEKNVAVLFSQQPAHIQEFLSDHLSYAETHVAKALSEEVEFQAMEHRLYLALRLAEYVLGHMVSAVSEIERELSGIVER